jgi:hypothetical protein
MDLIYLILATPLAVAVSFTVWKFKQYNRDLNRLPEAKPYQFERDEFIPHFDEYTQMLTQRKINKNKNEH